MDILAPFRFEFYSPLAIDDAWQELVSITHQTQLSLFSKVETPEDDPGREGIFLGELRPHHFKLMVSSRSWLTDGPPFVLSGTIQKHLGGCKVEAMVRPALTAAVLYIISLVWFLGFSARQIFEARGFNMFGFVILGGLVAVNTIFWLVAVRRFRKLLSTILDGKELVGAGA